MAVSQQFALAGLWDIANVMATPSVANLKEGREPLFRLLERQRSTAITHAIPFTSDKEAAGSATLEFRFDVGPLMKSLQGGGSTLQVLGELADETARVEWIHRSSEDDKSVLVRTPYKTELSLAIVREA